MQEGYRWQDCLDMARSEGHEEIALLLEKAEAKAKAKAEQQKKKGKGK